MLTLVKTMWFATLLLLITASSMASSAKILPNATLFLPSVIEKAKVNFNILNVDQVIDHTTHYLQTLDQTKSIVYHVLSGASLTWGTIYHFLLFKKVWNNGGFNKPINVMTGITCT